LSNYAKLCTFRHVKRGRPRSLNLHPPAIEYLLAARRVAGTPPTTKAALCEAVSGDGDVSLTPTQLGDALGSRHKGVNEAVVRRIALILECEPEHIAPELTGRFAGLRPGDPAPEAVPA